MEVAGPFGTLLGLAQRKRASPRGEAGTSGFLSVSDSDRRVLAELGQETQASSCLRKGTPLASRVAQGDVRRLVELCVEPAGLCAKACFSPSCSVFISLWKAAGLAK